jgi:DNA helicase-2/ATP-dependent DNA helicase PcrA
MYDDGHVRAADIAQLEQIAAGYDSRERFLTELTLDPPDATSGRARAKALDEDYTILSTIHSAKGQEWRIVRILNVVEAAFHPIWQPEPQTRSRRKGGCCTWR